MSSSAILIKEFLEDIKHEEIKQSQLDWRLLQSIYSLLIKGEMGRGVLKDAFEKIINAIKRVQLSNKTLKRKWKCKYVK